MNQNRQMSRHRRDSDLLSNSDSEDNNRSVSKVKIGERLLMRGWLIKHVEENTFPGLEWLNPEKTLIKIPWVHGSRQIFNPEKHSGLFKAWAEHTGRGNLEADPTNWKAKFRCALNSLPDVKHEPKFTKKGQNAYKVYRLDKPQRKETIAVRKGRHSSKHLDPYIEDSSTSTDSGGILENVQAEVTPTIVNCQVLHSAFHPMSPATEREPTPSQFISSPQLLQLQYPTSSEMAPTMQFQDVSQPIAGQFIDSLQSVQADGHDVMVETIAEDHNQPAGIIPETLLQMESQERNNAQQLAQITTMDKDSSLLKAGAMEYAVDGVCSVNRESFSEDEYLGVAQEILDRVQKRDFQMLLELSPEAERELTLVKPVVLPV